MPRMKIKHAGFGGQVLWVILSLVTCIEGLPQAKFEEVSANNPIFLSDHSFRGVVVADYDNDGDDDFYVLNVTEGATNILYRNEGNFMFTDASKESGLEVAARSKTAIWFDADNDGWLDIYFTGLDDNHFMKNNGDGTFSDLTRETALERISDTRSLMVGDLNGDHRPDLFCHNAHFYESVFYANQGGLRFVNETKNSGITTRELPSMGAVMLDLDEDGDLDIYCTYDNHFPNKYYQNNGSGQFTEIGESLNLNYRGDGMGVDFADFDHNGYYDFYITNFYPNALLMQQPEGTFIDQAVAKGVGDEGMGWGTVCLDYNNDSYADIFMVNSAHPAGTQGFTNKLYRNNGDGSFSSTEQGSPLDTFMDSWSCASADFNDDGLMDLVIVNTNGNGVQVMKNNEDHTGNWISMNLVGTGLNKFAVGARLEVWHDGFAFKDEITVGSGYSGQNSYTLHFGLGTITTIDSLVVHWPTGTVDKYYQLDVNKRLLLVEDQSLEVFEVNAYTRALGVGVITGISDKYDLPLSIHPIPAQNTLYIEGLANPSNVKIQVTDLLGRQKYLRQNFTGDRIELDTGTLAPGIYLLQSLAIENRFIKKIVIE